MKVIPLLTGIKARVAQQCSQKGKEPAQHKQIRYGFQQGRQAEIQHPLHYAVYLTGKLCSRQPTQLTYNGSQCQEAQGGVGAGGRHHRYRP